MRRMYTSTICRQISRSDSTPRARLPCVHRVLSGRREGAPGHVLGDRQPWAWHRVAPATRPAREDSDDPGGEADQDPGLPGAVVGTQRIENQPAAPGAEGGADLVHHEGEAEQRRHVARAEHFRDQPADERRHAEPQHAHRRGEDECARRGRRHHEKW